MPEVIGDLAVQLTGDYSELVSDFSAAQGKAAEAGTRIASAFNTSATSANSLEERIQALVDSGHSLSEALRLDSQAMDAVHASASAAADATHELAENVEPLGAGAESAAQSLEKFAAHAHEAGDSSVHAHEGSSELLHTLLEFSGIAISVEALKEFVLEAIATFAAVEKATVALTALMGSAEAATTAIEGLKELALADALSFPSLLQAQQRLTAFGVSADSIPHIMESIANAAAATNRDFGDTANVFERIIASGNAMGRSLVSLGITTSDLAKAMQVAEGDVKEAFKALDQADRIAVLETALKKFDGTAAAVAETLSGQWQRLKTQAEFTFEGIGEAIAPVALALAKLASVALTATDQMIVPIKELSHSYVTLFNDFKGITDGFSALVSTIAGAEVTFKDITEWVNTLHIGFNAMMPALQLLNETLKLYHEVLVTIKGDTPGVTEAATATDKLAHVDAKPTAKGLEDVSKSTKELGSNAKDAAPQLDHMMIALANLRREATIWGAEFQKAWNLSVMSADLLGVNRATEALLKTQTDAVEAYQKAKLVLADVTQKLKDHQATQYDVIRATNAVKDAYEAAYPKIKGAVVEAVIAAKSAWDSFLKDLNSLESSEIRVREFAAIWRDAVSQFGKDSEQARIALKLYNDELAKLGTTSEAQSPSLADTAKKIEMIGFKATEAGTAFTKTEVAVQNLSKSSTAASDAILAGFSVTKAGIDAFTFSVQTAGSTTNSAFQLLNAAGTQTVGTFTQASQAVKKLGEDGKDAAEIITLHTKATIDRTNDLREAALKIAPAFATTETPLTTMEKHLRDIGLVIDADTSAASRLSSQMQQTADAITKAGDSFAAVEASAFGGKGFQAGAITGIAGSLHDAAAHWQGSNVVVQQIEHWTLNPDFTIPTPKHHWVEGQGYVDDTKAPAGGSTASPAGSAPAQSIDALMAAYGSSAIPADLLKSFLSGAISADELAKALQALSITANVLGGSLAGLTDATGKQASSVADVSAGWAKQIADLQATGMSWEEAVAALGGTLVDIGGHLQATFDNVIGTASSATGSLASFGTGLSSMGTVVGHMGDMAITLEDAMSTSAKLTDANQVLLGSLGGLALTGIDAAEALARYTNGIKDLQSFVDAFNTSTAARLHDLGGSARLSGSDLFLPAIPPHGIGTVIPPGAITITINNPSFPNQQSADYLVNQLRSLGLR